MVSLDATVVVAAFPAFRDHFAQASASQLSWVLNGYTIMYAALLVPAGRWADLHGRKGSFLPHRDDFVAGHILINLPVGAVACWLGRKNLTESTDKRARPGLTCQAAFC